MADRPERIYGERRRMTVVFSDLVGSTPMAEGMDLEILGDILSAYLDACSQVVNRFDGHIAKFLGDGILAYFGFPRAQEDDAKRAVLAGLGMVEAVEGLAEKVGKEHGADLRVRVAVHTGPVVVAEMGSQMEIFGSTPNQADRIQTEAEPGTVVISSETERLISGYFDLESMGSVQLRGMSEPMELLHVLGPTDAQTRLEAAMGAMTPLVGRAEDKRLLGSLWEETSTQDQSHAVLLRGGAGIGKSRLAAFVRDLSARTGGSPLQGNCSPYLGSTAFHPLVRMLERRCGFEAGAQNGKRLIRLEEELERSGADLGELVPFFAPLLAVPLSEDYEAPQLDPLQLRERTMAAFSLWWEQLAAAEPLVMVIEDLHWAEPSTIELLHRQITEAPPPGMLLVLTARSEFHPAWEANPNVVVHELGPLETSQRIEMVKVMPGTEPLSRELTVELAERSDGVPLFLEELVRSADPEGPAGSAVPATLHDLLLARLESGDVDLRLAQIAATIGRSLDVDLLQTVSGLDDSQLESGLATLVTSGILESRGTGEQARYAFRHSLIRDTAYESQLRATAREVHSKVADVLVGKTGMGEPVDKAVIALHLDQAERLGEAVWFYVFAAQDAQAAGAFPEALKQLDRALEIIEASPEGEERDFGELTVRILRALSLTYTQGYGSADAYNEYRRSLDLSDSLRHRPESVGVLLAVWAYLVIRGRRDESAQVISDLNRRLAEAEPSEASLFDAEVVVSDGLQHYVLGDYDEARRLNEESIELFLARPEDTRISPIWQLPNDPLVAAHSLLMPIYWVQGDRDAALAAAEQAFSRARDLNFPVGPFSTAYAYAYYGFIHQLHGDFKEAAEEFEEMTSLSARHGFAMWQGLGSINATIAASTAGATSELVQGLNELRQTLYQMGVWSFQPYFITAEAELTAQLGDAEASLALFDQAIAMADETSELHYQAETHRKRAGVRLATDPEATKAAAEDLQKALNLATEQNARVFRLRAAIDLHRLEEAARPPGVTEALAEALAAMEDAEAYPEVDEARKLLAEAG